MGHHSVLPMLTRPTSLLLLLLLAGAFLVIAFLFWTRDTDHTDQRSVQAVLLEHRNSLEALPGVLGTAIGTCNGEFCIRVYVSERTQQIEQSLPRRLGGYDVVIREDSSPSTPPPIGPAEVEAVEAVIRRHRQALRAVADVLGTGVTTCGAYACIKIYTSELSDAVKSLPSELDGYDVIIEKSGPIEITPIEPL